MSSLLTKLLEPLLPPGLRGDHNHGHDGPDGLLGLGHEGDGHGHGHDVGQNDGPVSYRNTNASDSPGPAHSSPFNDSAPGSPASQSGGGSPPGYSGGPASGLPGAPPSPLSGLLGGSGHADGSILGGLLPGGPLSGQSPSTSSSPLSSIVNLPLAQVASLASGLGSVVQAVLGSQPATPNIADALPGSIQPPNPVASNGSQAVVPGQGGELAAYRADARTLSQPINTTSQILSQGIVPQSISTSALTAAAVPTTASSAQTAGLSTPLPGTTAQIASTAVPQQAPTALAGRLDASAANAQVARNDIAFLPGNTLPGTSQLSQSPAALVQARADVVPATVAPQVAGSTIMPGAQLAQPGQLQSSVIRPGMDGMPVAPKEGLAGPIAGHTAEGVRRRGYGLDGRRLPGMLGWLSLPKSLPLDHPLADDPAVRAAERAYTWLFWVLAFVGYASLAFAIIAMVPSGSQGFIDDSGRRLSGGGMAAIAGALAVIGAWCLVRRSRKAMV